MYTSDSGYVKEYKDDPSKAVDYGDEMSRNKKSMLSNMMVRYLIAAAVTAAAGLIYEYFSHGVYSVFMLGAFLIPLIGGALPCLIAEKDLKRKLRKGGPNQMVPGGKLAEFSRQMVTELQLAAVTTLTAGSLMQGALEIYGTTNRLMIVFPAAGAGLASAAVYLAAVIRRGRLPLKRIKLKA